MCTSTKKLNQMYEMCMHNSVLIIKKNTFSASHQQWIYIKSVHTEKEKEIKYVLARIYLLRGRRTDENGGGEAEEEK